MHFLVYRNQYFLKMWLDLGHENTCFCLIVGIKNVGNAKITLVMCFLYLNDIQKW